jgi:hypothetical protein
MKRGFLHWFYLAVQFVMLAVSIPKVAMLFHAYDPETLGPLIGGVDVRSWLVGLAIDLTATFTTWAAMHKYEETRRRVSLIAPAFIIIMCTGLSVVANYEDAATLAPHQYSGVSLFAQPALFINPILISAPPVLVFLLILLVPSVLAQPRIKSAAEVLAESEQEAAQIEADARLREARARANARVRSAQVSGLMDTVSVVTTRTTSPKSAPLDELPDAPEHEDERASDPSTPALTRAMWNALSLKDRVLQSGLMSAQEVAEVLMVSVAHARKLLKDVRLPDDEKRAVAGRSGVPYQLLIDALYQKRTRESFAQAHKLELALGVRKRTRQLPASAAEDAPDPGEQSA